MPEVKGTRRAFLVVTDTYTDATFSRLRAPQHDATALAKVLGDQEIGGYAVTVLVNQPSHEIRLGIEGLFHEAGRDDLILLYVSGHGVKDDDGKLLFGAMDTHRNRLASTAVSARFVRDQIDRSPARKVVVWLDCCYAGAFPAGGTPKADGSVDVLPQLSAGRGCAIMTASTHIQYAFEHGKNANLSGKAQPSVFTNAIVEGLRTGDADLNADGEIDAAELYHYVYDRVKDVAPNQTPTCNHQVTGALYIAHSKRGPRHHLDVPAPPQTRADRRRQQPPWVVPRLVVPRRGRVWPGQLTTRLLVVWFAVTLGIGSFLDPSSLGYSPETPEWIHIVFGVLGILVACGVLPFLLLTFTRFVCDRRSKTVWRAGAAPFGACGSFAVGREGILATASGKGEVWLWNWKWSSDGPVLELDDVQRIAKFTIDSMAFSTNGEYLAGVEQGTVKAWNTVSWKPVVEVRPDSGVTSLGFSPDGNVLATINTDGEITLWSTADVRDIRMLTSHGLQARSLAYSPDGRTLASTASDGTIRLWNTDTWDEPRRLDGPRRNSGPLAFSPDGTLLACGYWNGIRLWRTSDWTPVRSLIGHQQSVRSLAFGPDGGTLISAANDGMVKLWQIDV